MIHGYLKLCNAVYWLALTMWIAALASAGIAAMNVFGTLQAMPIRLERFSALPLEAHGRIAAGQIMEGVFFTVDVIQFVAAPLTVLMLLAQLAIFRLPLRSPSNLIRTVCVLGAACVLAFHAVMLAPAMNRHLRQYWRSAEAGDLAVAHSHLDQFNDRHVVANRLLQANLVLLVIGVAASAAALGPARPRSDLHIPALLRMR